MPRSKLILLLAVLMMALCVSAARAQDDDDDDVVIDFIPEVVQCLAPTAYKFDEVEFADTKKLERVIRDFRENLYALPAETRGLIYVYGGQMSRFDEIAEITKTVEGKVGLGNNRSSKVAFVNGGYRRVATVEFTIKPLDCSEALDASPDLTIEDIRFEEFPAADSVRLSRDDIRSQVSNEVFGKCPAAASAMHVCSDPVQVEVFVAVDKTGTVRFAKQLGGHPLLRAAAASAAMQWKFRPLVAAGMPKNFVGVILVRFPPETR